MSEGRNQRVEGGFRVDFYIHAFSKKRTRQNEKREVFLQSVEGHVEPGTVCAIIGPRNSGKARLLQLLSGRTNKHICLGEVHVNGAPFAAPQMRAMTSYLTGAGSTLVPQMTVQESVDFTARLVLASSDKAARKKKVEQVLEEMQLMKVKDSRIDGGVKGEAISAESRVRVNLAQVLMEGKQVIFLDEPTQGLDLLAAERVVKDIISLAELKLLTVFVSLEHPTKLLLEKFQKCLFLSEGRQVYFGRVRHAVDFFSRLGYPIPEETSIYDHILGLTVPDESQTDTAEKYLEKLLQQAQDVFEEIQMAKLNATQRKMRKEQLMSIRKNNYYIKLETDSYQHYPISWASQVRVLMTRFWTSFKRDFTTFLWRVVITMAWIALFFGLCRGAAEGDRFPEDFSILLQSLLLGFAGIQGLSLLALPQAQGFARMFESDMDQNLYRPSAYVVAHLFVSFFSLAFTQIPVAICYFFFLGLETKLNRSLQDLLYFGLIQLLLAVISEVLALSVALISARESIMYLSAGAIHFLWLVFSGGIVPLCDRGSAFLAAVSYASPSKWALDGLLLVTINTKDYKVPSAVCGNEAQNYGMDGSEALETYYCFHTWRHAANKALSFIAMGGMLGLLLVAFFISARLVQIGFRRN